MVMGYRLWVIEAGYILGSREWGIVSKFRLAFEEMAFAAVASGFHERNVF